MLTFFLGVNKDNEKPLLYKTDVVFHCLNRTLKKVCILVAYFFSRFYHKN